jgi:transcriptional regulator GlxA family with amidase domain
MRRQRSAHTGAVGVRTIGVVMYDGVNLLDVVGPAEVWFAADRVIDGLGLEGRDAYRVVTIGDRRASLGACGITVDAQLPWRGVPEELDTLVVPGGMQTAMELDPAVVRALPALIERSRRVMSVCNGAFYLGEAGLLDGRQVTTHWAWAAELARRFPAALVDARRLVSIDGPVVTTGGVASGIDATLELVARDDGEEVARLAAKWLVVPRRRPEGQSPFAAQPLPVPGRGSVLWPAVRAMSADAPPACLAELAALCHLSDRQLRRVFHAELGMAPTAYLERLRVARVVDALDSGDRRSLSLLAEAAGFADAQSLRRAFQRTLGMSPAAFRRQFAAARE